MSPISLNEATNKFTEREKLRLQSLSKYFPVIDEYISSYYVPGHDIDICIDNIAYSDAEHVASEYRKAGWSASVANKATRYNESSTYLVLSAPK